MTSQQVGSRAQGEFLQLFLEPEKDRCADVRDLQREIDQQ